MGIGMLIGGVGMVVTMRRKGQGMGIRMRMGVV